MVVSDTVKEYYKNGSHGKLVTISFPDLDYTVPSENVYFESLDLEEAIFDGDSFEAVGCIASKFEISIRDFGEDVKGQKIVADIDLVDVEDSTIRLFTGIVDSVQMESNKQVKKITAYDALYALGNTDAADWYKSLTFPISIGAFRHSLCSHIGLNEASATLPNDSITINKQYNPNTLNALDLLKNICQINGVFGIINRQGYMEYRVPSASTAEEIPYTRDIEYQEYLVDPVDKLTIRQDQDSPGVSYGTGNNNYIIQGNFFTYGLSPETVYSIARNMYSNVSSFTYRPFKASNNGLPFIELGLNNSVAYRVYDFENSSSGHDVYKNITVIVMSRHLKGIQSIVDDYEAKGNEDQRLFISDLGTEIQALKETIENLDKASSTEIAVYRNQSQITIQNGNSAVIADISFTAENGNTVVFNEELSLTATPIEIVRNEQYIEGEVEVLITYYLNGNVLYHRQSNGIVPDGKYILHLMQFWKAGISTSYRLQTVMKVIGGTVAVAKYNANAYITVRTSEFNDFQIVVVTEPTKTQYTPGESLDYSGLSIRKVYYDESVPTEDVTSKCAFSPIAGTIYNEPCFITVNVLYQEENESGELIDYTTQFYCSYEYTDYDIEITQEPTKLTYYLGEALDYSGLVVMKIYADSSIPSENITDLCSITPSEGTIYNKVGDITVEVEYQRHVQSEAPTTKRDTFSVEYVEDEFTLTVVNPPAKTSYRTGESADWSGAYITATYQSGKVVNVTNACLFTPANGTTLSSYDTEVEVEYTDEYGQSDSTSFNISVKEIERIVVASPPDKVVYYVNETTTATLDFTGLIIEAVYSDSSREDVTDQCTFHPAEGTHYTYQQSGEVEVEVTYTDEGETFDTTFIITIVVRDVTKLVTGATFKTRVHNAYGAQNVFYITRSATPPPVPTGLVVQTMPTKTEYVVGEILDYTGIVIMANFTNIPPFDCTSQCTFTPAEGSIISTIGSGTLTVDISYVYDGTTAVASFNLIIH